MRFHSTDCYHTTKKQMPNVARCTTCNATTNAYQTESTLESGERTPFSTGGLCDLTVSASSRGHGARCFRKLGAIDISLPSG